MTLWRYPAAIVRAICLRGCPGYAESLRNGRVNQVAIGTSGRAVTGADRINNLDDPTLGRPGWRQSFHPGSWDSRVLLEEQSDGGIQAAPAEEGSSAGPGKHVAVNAERDTRVARHPGNGSVHAKSMGPTPLSAADGSLTGAAIIGAMISRTDVEHIAELARLGLTDAEIDLLVPQLSRILEAVGKLAAVDTSSVGPTAQVIVLENVMRDDVARAGMSREAALAEAPRREGSLLRVPVVLEEGR